MPKEKTEKGKGDANVRTQKCVGRLPVLSPISDMEISAKSGPRTATLASANPRPHGTAASSSANMRTTLARSPRAHWFQLLLKLNAETSRAELQIPTFRTLLDKFTDEELPDRYSAQSRTNR